MADQFLPRIARVKIVLNSQDLELLTDGRATPARFSFGAHALSRGSDMPVASSSKR
jgi:hypothetical protein